MCVIHMSLNVAPTLVSLLGAADVFFYFAAASTTTSSSPFYWQYVIVPKMIFYSLTRCDKSTHEDEDCCFYFFGPIIISSSSFSRRRHMFANLTLGTSSSGCPSVFASPLDNLIESCVVCRCLHPLISHTHFKAKLRDRDREIKRKMRTS